MDTFKIFTIRINGNGRVNSRTIMSLKSINMLMDASACPTFTSWEQVRQKVLAYYGSRFGKSNTICLSLHELINTVTVDPQPFKNSCIVFKIYDL